MRRIDLKSLAFGVLLGAGAFFTIAASSGTGRTPIEYRVIKGSISDEDFQTDLNKAAAQGWQFEDSDTYTDRFAYAIMSRPRR